ncbi:hypothetical protein I317_06302 [Kwoniella heveanensis CBS 569]|uniref:Uncharacterized protein n=1 Tax=Kwoniella heveanensis BCC8398 TaxID=1296120 RepID=A0A1B9GV60_9TREE|nr:hypothetical protein I316_03477 [Kwoniella heveanensis BCC8398]OCF39928.1 hypothetical protein I317_06302 [Kwoniella heveanensis CBS 569]
MDITTLEPLQPVLHVILDILKTDCPHLLLPVSKELYRELLPTVYERVEVDGPRLGQLLHGLVQYTKTLDLNIAPDRTESDCRSGTDDPESDDSKNAHEDIDSRQSKKIWDYGYRKAEALGLIKYLRLNNLNQDDRVDEIMETFFSGCYSPIFPSLEHLSLSREMTEYLWPAYAYPSDRDIDRQQGIFINLTAIDRPRTLCVEWPEEWKYSEDKHKMYCQDSSGSPVSVEMDILLSDWDDTEILYLHLPYYVKKIDLDVESEIEVLEVVMIVKDPSEPEHDHHARSVCSDKYQQQPLGVFNLVDVIDTLWNRASIRHNGAVVDNNIVLPIPPDALGEALDGYIVCVDEDDIEDYRRWRKGVRSKEDLQDGRFRCPCGH